MNPCGRLTGRSVLVVEDQWIIASAMESALIAAGCEVVGPVARLKPAMELARHEQFDFGLLDVNLAGEQVYPLADLLECRGIPFLLTTGYGEAAVTANQRNWKIVSKPYDCSHVVDLIVATLGAPPSATTEVAPK